MSSKETHSREELGFPYTEGGKLSISNTIPIQDTEELESGPSRSVTDVLDNRPIPSHQGTNRNIIQR